MAKYIPCDGPGCPNPPTVIMTFINEGRTVYYCDEHYAGLVMEMAAFMLDDSETPLLTDEGLAELAAEPETDTEPTPYVFVSDLQPLGFVDDREPEAEAEPETEPER